MQLVVSAAREGWRKLLILVVNDRVIYINDGVIYINDSVV